ncbi:MAG TPA: hypothetical protein VMO78_00255 [Rhizomicrobium sp.]|nr:hypothetical protein [Rhizomicrobium sp.]
MAKRAVSDQAKSRVEPGRFLLLSLEIVVGGFAILLLGGAFMADQAWFDRHFLPIFAIRHSVMIAAEQGVRGFVILTVVILLLICRRPITLFLGRATVGGILRVVLAGALALGTVELILRVHPLHPHDADPLELEPRRQSDPLLGWKFVPSRSAVAREAGRPVPYSFNAASYRIPAPGTEVDFARPTLIFTGESIIVGFGLTWDETIPAQVSALVGIQSANLAVSDYSNDQSYLRLAAELPRFQKPVAVVTLFMPLLFDRNLLKNRPSLGPALVWHPPEQQWRLAALLHWLVPYRSVATIDEGILRTRDSLGALVHLACARGAQPLIVVPQFGEASPVEEALRRRILDEAGLPYVSARLDPTWHLPGDAHPDARGARAIAAAVVARLRLNNAPSVSKAQWKDNCGVFGSTKENPNPTRR